MVEQQAPTRRRWAVFKPAEPAKWVVVTSTGHSVGGHRSCESRDFPGSHQATIHCQQDLGQGGKGRQEKKRGRERRTKIDFTPLGREVCSTNTEDDHLAKICSK